MPEFDTLRRLEGADFVASGRVPQLDSVAGREHLLAIRRKDRSKKLPIDDARDGASVRVVETERAVSTRRDYLVAVRGKDYGAYIGGVSLERRSSLPLATSHNRAV